MSEHDATGPDPMDPKRLEELLRQLGISGTGGDPTAMLAALQERFAQFSSQFEKMFGATGGDATINWEGAKHAARQTVAMTGSDPSPSASATARVVEVMELAQTWISQHTSVPALAVNPVAWSRAEWVEGTMPVWERLVEPVVGRLGEALEKLAAEGHGGAVPPEGAGMMRALLQGAASAFFSAQVGQAVGTLATSVVGPTDAGLPLTATPRLALLPVNLEAHCEGLAQPERDVWMHVAAREAARARLFAHVTWLPTQILALIEHYARDITFDSGALREAMDQMNGADPDQLAELVSGGDSLFQPTVTEEQTEVLERLETLMALTEGWVDVVAGDAVRPWLKDAAALDETIRRRRAAGGPAENVLASLVGLRLQPRRIRDAANLWRAMDKQQGAAARDDIWHHPDMLPTASDLSDPMGFVAGDSPTQQSDDLDREIAELLEGDGNSGTAAGDTDPD